MIMATRFVKMSDVLAHLRVTPEFLRALEAEELIQCKRTSEGETVLSVEDVERVRLAVVLTSELEVNLPGVEVILHMRDSMAAMYRQFGEILEALVEEMRRQVPR